MSLRTKDRTQSILRLLAENGPMSVSHLSNELNVSEVTIRADLDLLQEAGKVVRFHGGARLAENSIKQEFNFQARKMLNLQKKKDIGQAAAALVESSDSILVDASTSALAMVAALRQRTDLYDVTIIPTGIWTAIELMGCTNFNILLPGGYLRHTSGSVTGRFARDFFSDLLIQKAFLGAWGVSATQGFTDSHLLEVELKKNILSRVKEIIVLADGSKFTQSGLAPYASAGEVSRLITDQTAPDEEIETLRKAGVIVTIV